MELYLRTVSIWGLREPTRRGDYTSNASFNYYNHILDVCPGDGLGVSFYFHMEMVTSGTGGGTQLSTIKGSDNGCGSTEKYFSGPVSKAHGIKRTRLVSCWTNDGNLCWAVPLDGMSTWKDNPYT